MTPTAGEDRSQGLSDQLAAMFDAVIAAESVPRFLAVIEDVLRRQGLELVVLGVAADGTPVEAAAAALDHGELTLEPKPRVPGGGRQDAVVLGRAAAAGRPDGELVLRRAGGGEEPALPVAEMAAHVLRALRLHRALVGGQVRGQATTIVLDAIPLGVILVNASARVLQANRLGEEILSLADGLAADRSGLSTPTRADTDRLRHVIAQVAAATAAANATPVGVLRLERPSLRPPWMVVVVPVHTRRRADTVSEIAALFVTETMRGEPSHIPVEALARLFALTPAEARLLLALVDGYGLNEIAEQFAVSKNTLRNQLNQVFRKTNTNKQSELVRMVLSSPAAILGRPRFPAGGGEG